MPIFLYVYLVRIICFILVSLGYYRANWGEDMTLGTIGGGLGQSWTGRYYPMWYECGVSIP